MECLTKTQKTCEDIYGFKVFIELSWVYHWVKPKKWLNLMTLTLFSRSVEDFRY